MRMVCAISAAIAAAVAPHLTSSAVSSSSFSANAQPAAQRQDTIVRIAGNPVYPGVATLKEDLSIGQTSGPEEYMLANLEDAHYAWEGSILIADAGSAGGRIGTLSTLRRYDSTGKFVRAYGRGGQGPGEFRDFNGMAILRDGRLVLNDNQSRMIHVYGPTGNHITSWSIPRNSLGAGTTNFMVNPNGSMYLMLNDRATGAATITRRFVMVINTTGAIADTIDAPIAPQMPVSQLSATGASGGERRTTVPFSPTFRTVFSPMGYYISARTDRYAIDLHTPAGQITSIRRNVAPLPVTAEERTAWRNYIDSTMRRQQPGWTWNGPDIPRTKPYFMEVFPDMEGRIWVRVYDAAEKILPGMDMDDASINYWDVFEPSGRFLGRVRTPVGTLPFYARGDRLIGLAQNADGVQRVVRYKITWSAEK